MNMEEASLNKELEKPKVVAIIPARGGSKRTPSKNVLPIAGKPLIAHSIEAAREATSVMQVFVSTDDQEIAAVSRGAGAEIIWRPSDISHDEATSESALLHALKVIRTEYELEPDLIVFLQCTSAVRSAADIDGAVQHLLDQAADSLLSATRFNKLVWAVDAEGKARSVNWDYRHRKREQDMDIQFQENGSIYVFEPWVLEQFNNRLGGRIVIYEMGYWSSFQIDSPEDVGLVDWIMRRSPRKRDSLPDLRAVQLVVFDFDGVFTDNRVYVSQDGVESVACDRGDGLGIARLRKMGVPMMVLSTETNPVVAARSAKLKLPCHQGVDDKLAFLTEYLASEGIDPAHVIYLGNDVNDLACLKLVGLPVAVADAHPEVHRVARWALDRRGGEGAVRELCDLLADHLASANGGAS